MRDDEPALPAVASRSRRWIVGCVAALALVCLGSAGVVYARLQARLAEARALRERVERAVARHRQRRWERPLLRGTPIAGNAAHEIMYRARRIASAIRRSERDQQRLDTLMTVLRDAGPLPDDDGIDVLLRAQHQELERLRAAGRRTYAQRRLDVSLTGDAPAERPTDTLLAGKLLVAEALRVLPDDCLSIAADLVRLGQDLTPGAGLVPRMLLDVHAVRAARLVARCGPLATDAALDRTRRELELLAAHMPPLAWTLETESLFVASALATVLPTSPWATSAERADALLQLDAVLQAAEEQLAGAERWRTRESWGYAAVHAAAEREDRRRAASDNPLTALSVTLSRYTRRAGRAEAAVRAAALALAAVAEGRTSGQRLPERPARLGDPALADPLGGGPLRWVRAADGQSARIGWTPPERGKPAVEDELVVRWVDPG